MYIAKLCADHRYRSLHLKEVVFDQSDAVEFELIAPELFHFDDPIGTEWRVRDVAYLSDASVPSEDCCEADADCEGLSESTNPIGDFPHFWGINFGVFTKRSYDALHKLIAPYVEFLPLHSEEGEFVAFKVLKAVDALNRDESAIEWFPQLKKDIGKPRFVRQIRKFVFYEDRLSEEIIFRLPEMPLGTEIFVTERFIEAVESQGLQGFQFTQVWPTVDDDREKFMQKRLRKRKRRH